jgi:hypothetical protein
MITASMPALCSSAPSSRPDGPAPMMATWTFMHVLLRDRPVRGPACTRPAPPADRWLQYRRPSGAAPADAIREGRAEIVSTPARSFAMAVQPIPDGYHAVTPYLIVDGAAQALEFYKQVFGATEQMRMAAPNGRVGHAEMRIGDSVVMLADEVPDMGYRGPKATAAARSA